MNNDAPLTSSIFKDAPLTSSIFKSSFIKHLTISILENPDMSNQFVVSPLEELPTVPHIFEQTITEEEDQDTPEEPSKSQVSRLQIEIKKNDFDLVPVVGEHFLLLFTASLEGKHLMQGGHLMMTNYRILFFRDCLRRVDMPFGAIRDVQFNDKELKVTFRLKYPHSWKFQITNPRKKYSFLKTFCPFYIKPTEVRNNFAYQHFLKDKDHTPYRFDLDKQYSRLGFQEDQWVREYHNEQFAIPSYPHNFFIPISLQNENAYKTACSHRKNNRLPILVYLYKLPHSTISVPLWISSSYQQKEIKSAEKQLLQNLSMGLKLEVFVIEGKSGKACDESSFWPEVAMNYLKLEGNEETKNSEVKLMQVLLYKKTPLILQIIETGWYKHIGRILESVALIRNVMLSQKGVLVRCENGWDKSLTIASLVQMVVEPYFRTIEGFQKLVMRMFVQGGHPFASRLGERNTYKDMCPIFLQFLDCVSQLINQNETAFEFNFKYLSKLANLMQNNLYGTFIADSPREYSDYNIEAETVAIWEDLKDISTLNGHYSCSQGFLHVSGKFNASRMWKEYFCSLISRKQDHYGFQPYAEDNDDYVSIASVRLQEENDKMKEAVREQKKLIEQLQAKLQNLNM